MIASRNIWILVLLLSASLESCKKRRARLDAPYCVFSTGDPGPGPVNLTDLDGLGERLVIIDDSQTLEALDDHYDHVEKYGVDFFDQWVDFDFNQYVLVMCRHYYSSSDHANTSFGSVVAQKVKGELYLSQKVHYPTGGSGQYSWYLYTVVRIPVEYVDFHMEMKLKEIVRYGLFGHKRHREKFYYTN